MRILHFTEACWPRIGGIETLLHNLIAWQQVSGDTVLVLAEQTVGGLSAYELYSGTGIHRKPFADLILKNDMAGLARVVRETTALIRSSQPDVIHLHISSGAFPWLYALAQRTSPVPCVVTVHVPRPGVSLPDAILAGILNNANCLTAVSEPTRAEWFAHDPALVGKSRVVANGVPWPAGQPRPLCFDPLTLLCVGRLHPLKGFDVAVRAFARISMNFPGSRLIIAGDGPDRGNLEQLCNQLGLDTRVEFRGWVAPDQIAATVNEAALVLVPSLWREPFGLVAVEAAQMGRPVIASRVGGLAGCVVHEETGLLVPPGEPGPLTAAIEALARDPERARRLGTAARERARTFFSMEKCALAYRAIYNRLMRGTENPVLCR